MTKAHGKPMARNTNGRAGLTSSTTIPLGLASATLLVAFGGIWWASSLSAKVDYLTADVNGVRINLNTLTNEMANIKKVVDRIEWATGAESTTKKK